MYQVPVPDIYRYFYSACIRQDYEYYGQVYDVYKYEGAGTMYLSQASGKVLVLLCTGVQYRILEYLYSKTRFQLF
jgi:hypothetical protein